MRELLSVAEYSETTGTSFPGARYLPLKLGMKHAKLSERPSVGS